MEVQRSDEKIISEPLKTLGFIEEFLKEVGDEDLVFDGPKKARSADLFLYFPSVPGFISVRVETKGTWFIQTLCEVMREFAEKYNFFAIFFEGFLKVKYGFREDLLSIFKRTNRKIQEKIGKYEGRLIRIVPHMTLTVDRDFLLPIGYKLKFGTCNTETK